MRFPIVLTEGYDLHIFKSADHLKFDMEPQDVGDPQRPAYDADGHALRLSVEEVRTPRSLLGFKWVNKRLGVVAHDIDPPVDLSLELRAALLHYLVAGGHDQETIASLPIDELLALARRPMHRARRRFGARDRI
jgi:hypothetical protein